MPYKDPEKKRENNRKYYRKNLESVQARQREYRRNNREYMIVKGAKRRAKDRGLPFDLTPKSISIPEACPILGIALKTGKNHSRECSPSLDRIIPELGYVEGNVRVISQRANRLKSDASIEELEAILKYMKEHENDV